MEENVTPKRPNPRFDINNPKNLIMIILVILVVAIIGSGFFMVGAEEQAVVTRFGKVVRTVDPGLQFKIPLGIEQVDKVNVRGLRTKQYNLKDKDQNGYPVSRMLTGDLNIMDVAWTVNYKVSDPEAWLFNVDNPETTIDNVSQSVVNQLVGDQEIFSVMSNKGDLASQAVSNMQSKLDSYNIGATVFSVEIKNASAPIPVGQDELKNLGADQQEKEKLIEKVQDAFNEVNKAQQDQEKLIEEGKTQYNTEIPKARGEAYQMIQVAEGYASERINTAKGDVARFTSIVESYQQNKEVTVILLYLETIEEIFGPSDTIIDRDLENFLPLKNIGGTK